MNNNEEPKLEDKSIEHLLKKIDDKNCLDKIKTEKN